MSAHLRHPLAEDEIVELGEVVVERHLDRLEGAGLPHAAGEDLHFGMFDGLGGCHEPVHRRCHDVEPDLLRQVVHPHEQPLAPLAVDAVDPVAHRVAHRVPDLAVLPSAGLFDEELQLGPRIRHLGDAVSVGPRHRGDLLGGLGVEEVDGMRPGTERHHLPSRRGVDRVGAAVDVQAAVLVGAARLEPHNVERRARQLGGRHAILLEQRLAVLLLLVVLPVSRPAGPLEKLAVVIDDAVELGDGHEQIAPESGDLVLDAALLVA